MEFENARYKRRLGIKSSTVSTSAEYGSDKIEKTADDIQVSLNDYCDVGKMT